MNLTRLFAVVSVILVALSALAFPERADRETARSSEGIAREILPDAFSADCFTPNRGQVPCPEVAFHSRNAYFTATGVIFRVLPGAPDGGLGGGGGKSVDSYIFRTRFLGASEVLPAGRGLLPHHSNYFLGNDSSRWLSRLPNYEEIVYEDLYDDIDLVYRLLPGGLKYDFIVRPGGDPGDIRVKYEGAGVSTDGSRLLIKTPLGTLVDGGLFVYELDGGHSPLTGARMVVEGATLSFDVERPGDRAIVIDPLIYSTLLGGTFGDEVKSARLDGQNCTVVAGTTMSYDFPTTSGAFCTTQPGQEDVFVAKLSANGSELVFSTYLGGESWDNGNGVALDGSGDIYVTGRAGPGFPITAGAFCTTFSGKRDAFVLKLAADGASLAYSTFVGGAEDDSGLSIAVDGAGSAHVTGYMASQDFPSTPGAYCTTAYAPWEKVFVLKLAADGSSLRYCAHLYGWMPCFGTAIAVDDSGYVYVTGYSREGDFPTTPGSYCRLYRGMYDAFVLKLKPDGSDLVYSTRVGGTMDDYAYSLAIGPDKKAVVTGSTASEDFPTTEGAYASFLDGGGSDAFVFKLDENGSGLEYSTYLGGYYEDRGNSVCVDGAGCAYVTGSTGSSDFPVTALALDRKHNGMTDVFLTKLNSSGSGVLYSTFIGADKDEGGNSVLLDGSGNIALAGYTESSDFPTTPGAYNTTYVGWDSDAFILKLRFPVAPGPPLCLTAGAADRLVHLNWSPPDCDIEVPPLNYTIYRGTAPAALAELWTLGNSTFFNDTAVLNSVTYYYAVRATTLLGRGNLSDTVNATPGAAPSAPGAPKLALGDGFLELGWTPPADTGGFPVTGYVVYRGADGGPLSGLAAVGNLTGYNDSSVGDGRYYSYGVSAVNSRGEGPLSVTAGATAGRRPGAPQNLSARVASKTVILGWSAPAGNGGFEIAGYRVLRGRTPGDLSFVSEVGSLSFRDTDVQNGDVLYYAVSARNLRGEGAPSGTLEVRTGIRPEAPLLFAGAAGGCIGLWWILPDDGGLGVDRYTVYRGTGAELEPLENTTKTGYRDYDVVAGRTYTYAVSAWNGQGEGPQSNIVSVLFVPVENGTGAPQNLSAESGNAFVLLSWRPPRGAGASGVELYRIYRGVKAAGLALIGTSAFLGFEDTGVLNGVRYYYAVSAVVAGIERDRTAPVNATPQGEGLAPSPPRDLAAAAGDGRVSLFWNGPASPGGLELSGYAVYRGPAADSLALLSKAPGTSFNDTDLTNGRSFWYAVAAINARAEGRPTGPVEAIPLGPPGRISGLLVIPGDRSVSLRWSTPESSGGLAVTGYRLFRGPSRALMSPFAVAEAPEHRDVSVQNGVSYFYAVAAIGPLGEGPRSEPVEAVPGSPPAAPGNLRAQANDGRVALSWDAPAETGGFKVVGFRVYRQEGGGWRLLRNLTAQSYVDEAAPAGQRVFYRVTAVNERGEGNAAAAFVEMPGPAAAGTDTVLLALMVIAVAVAAAAMVLGIRRRSG